VGKPGGSIPAMNLLTRSIAAVVLSGVVLVPAVHARKSKSIVEEAVEAYQSINSTSVPAAGTIEVAFSPNEGSEHLVVKVIDSAKTELDLLSYSFTSVPVVEALVRARHRGVAVRLVADEKDNVSADRSGKARAALGALVNAGADVRTIRVYPIHHDKVIIADRQTVELGSFNYSDAAAHKNSENVLVNWGNPKLAEVYLKHFQRNYAQAAAYSPGY
jgi:phosphatidylserine/phosphatidylglycerophosphate/cardiolipin synthase-like enzyme